MISGDIKLTYYEYKKIIFSVNGISYSNPKLYSLLCNENNKYDPNIRYNKVSKTYIKNYTSWVIDPYSKNHPDHLIVKNRLSLKEELEEINNNPNFLMNEINAIIKDIDFELSKVKKVKKL